MCVYVFLSIFIKKMLAAKHKYARATSEHNKTRALAKGKAKPKPMYCTPPVDTTIHLLPSFSSSPIISPWQMSLSVCCTQTWSSGIRRRHRQTCCAVEAPGLPCLCVPWAGPGQCAKGEWKKDVEKEREGTKEKCEQWRNTESQGKRMKAREWMVFFHQTSHLHMCGCIQLGMGILEPALEAHRPVLHEEHEGVKNYHATKDEARYKAWNIWRRQGHARHLGNGNESTARWAISDRWRWCLD